jgi:hypothetical protein
MTGDYVPHQKVDIERPKMSPKEYKEEDLLKAAARLDKELGIKEAEGEGNDD